MSARLSIYRRAELTSFGLHLCETTITKQMKRSHLFSSFRLAEEPLFFSLTYGGT